MILRTSFFFAVAFAFLGLATADLAAQEAAFDSYRGVGIGTLRDDARESLGRTKHEYADEDNFEISDSETMRVFYTPEKRVKALVITFTGELDETPTADKILGEAVVPKPDGGAFKMVRFPEKGYWVSYLKTAGDSPSVVITMQRIPKLQS